jgi:predicted AlkP superfamily phosphohydrolase/phosphomutase
MNTLNDEIAEMLERVKPEGTRWVVLETFQSNGELFRSSHGPFETMTEAHDWLVFYSATLASPALSLEPIPLYKPRGA